MKKKFIRKIGLGLLFLFLSVNSFSQVNLGNLGNLQNLISLANLLGGGGSTDTAIVIDSVIQTSLCSGATIAVQYHTTTTFSLTNVFTAQLVVSPLSTLLGIGGGVTTPIDLVPVSGALGNILGGLFNGGTGKKTYSGTVPAGTPTGIYSIQLTSSNPAHTSATYSTPVIIDLPTVSVSSVCKNDSVFLTATTGGTNAVLSTVGGLLLSSTGLSALVKGGSSKVPLQWSTGDTAHTIYAGRTSVYSVTYTDTALGCSATSNLSVAKNPVKIDCQMEYVQLSSSVNAASYSWFIDSTLKSSSKSITLRNDINATYHLNTNSPFSCSSVDLYPTICADSNGLYVFVPTMFTPNGDGHNDRLYVRGNNISELTFSIYDRWGEVVFNTNDPKNGWDGTYKGKEVEPSVLVWYLKTKNYLGAEKEDKGYVTLMR
jgi:gliding motility-associated-like protein